MPNLKNNLQTLVYGTISALTGYLSFDPLSEVVSTRTSALQIQLTNTPMIEQMYETIEKITSGDLCTGVCLAITSGFTFAVTIYYSYREGETLYEEKQPRKRINRIQIA